MTATQGVAEKVMGKQPANSGIGRNGLLHMPDCLSMNDETAAREPGASVWRSADWENR